MRKIRFYYPYLTLSLIIIVIPSCYQSSTSGVQAPDVEISVSNLSVEEKLALKPDKYCTPEMGMDIKLVEVTNNLYDYMELVVWNQCETHKPFLMCDYEKAYLRSKPKELLWANINCFSRGYIKLLEKNQTARLFLLVDLDSMLIKEYSFSAIIDSQDVFSIEKRYSFIDSTSFNKL